MSMIKWDNKLGPDFDRTVSDAEAIMQKVFVRIQTYKGEYILDDRAGLDWERYLTVKPFPAGELRDRLYRQILETEGVESVDDLQVVQQSASVVINMKLTLEPEEDPRDIQLEVGF